ncbi:hypothetical protein Patl1_14246 [Pistacia atlantica]|uniref:Uncharacterized protein n=1 Tax=Pistacia atlantica TaxID=434234 RepID=A0ACC1AW93_9ROSI|nr:hypothetical protein Patl1_14246 [Pistacia atlantica]
MEMKGEEENRTVVVMGRAEIDTRSPFKSVKEAVSLFGERVLVKEIYGYKLKEKQAAASIENGGSDHKTRIGALTAELEGARQSLQKTKEEITKMSKCTRTLKQELEETKKELKLMKAKEYYNLKPQPVDNDDDGDDNYPKIEDLKFVENANPKEEEECDQKRKICDFCEPSCFGAGDCWRRGNGDEEITV